MRPRLRRCRACSKMPSFFGSLLYSGGILLPLFVVLTLIFFR
jgi:Putative citrate transport